MTDQTELLPDEERWRTLYGVMDHVSATDGHICLSEEEVRDVELYDGDLFLQADSSRAMAWLQCVGERWIIQLTICTCCPAIQRWEPFYLESPDVRVGKRTQDSFPGTTEAIRATRAWVLDRQMKDLARSS